MIKVDVICPNKINVDVTSTFIDKIIYEGAYVVASSCVKRTLSTSGKYMERDLTILPIPFLGEINSVGGISVYIG